MININWCNKHINLTFLFTEIVISIVSYFALYYFNNNPELNRSILYYLIPTLAIRTYIIVWYLKMKNRSLLWLLLYPFYVFINIGFIILLLLRNKNHKVEYESLA